MFVRQMNSKVTQLKHIVLKKPNYQLKQQLKRNKINITAFNRNSHAENTNTEQNELRETFSTSKHK